MIFNFWRPYRFFKPRKDGWYLCTVQDGYGVNEPKVLYLYFRKWDQRWINDTRQTVFDGYKVYESGKAPIEDYRVLTDIYCERYDVVAWKKLPWCYIWSKFKGDKK